jgi:hypothetical protein
MEVNGQLYPRVKESDTHCIGSWTEPRLCGRPTALDHERVRCAMQRWCTPKQTLLGESATYASGARGRVIMGNI